MTHPATTGAAQVLPLHAPPRPAVDPDQAKAADDAADALWADLDGTAVDPARNPLLAGWYSLNDVVAAMAIPAITKLIERNHGHPLGMTNAQWVARLEAMRDGFLAHVALDEPDVDRDLVPALVECRRRGLAVFAEHFDTLWD